MLTDPPSHQNELLQEHGSLKNYHYDQAPPWDVHLTDIGSC